MTAEETLQNSLDYNNCGDVDYFFPQRVKDAVLQAMTEYANLVSGEKDKRIAELEYKLTEMKNCEHDAALINSQANRIADLEFQNEELIRQAGNAQDTLIKKIGELEAILRDRG